MKRKITATSVIFTASLSLCSIQAQGMFIAPLNVEQTQIVNQSTGNVQSNYQVDGIDIELTEKDKVRAKNWNLTNKDWAKYKYVMEYTPRGLWTPDIDPPLALANASTTEADREYYISVQNQIEKHRTETDRKMVSTTNRLLMVGSYRTTPQPTGLASQLRTHKTELRSIFVDLKNCDPYCKRFVTLAIASTANSTQLDIHINGGSERQAEDFLQQIGVDENKIQAKGISINAQKNNPVFAQFNSKNNAAFYLNKTEMGTSRHDM